MTPRDVQTASLSEKLRRELGPVVLKALSDPDVIEIILNPDGRIWVESHTAGMSQTAASMAIFSSYLTVIDDALNVLKF